MTYTLFGSERSPFVRVIRMLFLKHKIDFRFEVLNFVDDPVAAAQLRRETPINKVPVLLDGDQKIFDSRVIVNHLTTKHGWPTLSLDEENIVSAIYSCMDVGVLLFLMKRDGLDVEGQTHFVKRNRQRIPDNLEFLLPWVRTLDPKRTDDWNYPAMSLVSFLYWGEHRAQVVKVADHPELQQFMKRFAEAPGVKETAFAI